MIFVRVNKHEYEFRDSDTGEGVENINRIHGIARLWSKSSKDYMFARDKMKALVTAKGGFSNLTKHEKTAAAKHGICTKSEALTILSENDRVKHNMKTTGLLMEARKSRVEKARQFIGSEVLSGDMTYEQGNTFLSDTKSMKDDFIEGANPAFINWLNGAEFPTKDYYTLARKNKLIDIIVNGL